jgi:predicted metal-binding membrane protein
MNPQRDRLLILTGLTGLALLAWAYTAHMGAHTPATAAAAIARPAAGAWDLTDLLAAFGMWTVMMTGMMLPAVAPWVLVLAGLARQDGRSGPFTAAGGFLTGYLAVWTGYSLAAAGLQWMLHQHALLTPALAAARPWLGGAILILAGVYQWTPVKFSCLRHCRSPLGFFLTSWRAGRWGAVRMGVQHGLYCVGCCWALMALAFVAGVMNLLWMAAITVFVFVDHAFPRGVWLSRSAGAALAAWGGWMVVGM